MSKDTEGSEERISELEDEVERLKAQLVKKGAEEADAGAVEAVRREGLTPAAEDAVAAEQFVPPRSRLILWGVLAGVLALGAVLLVTLMLSSGFNILSKKVAATVYPDDDPGVTQPRGETKAQPKQAPPAKDEKPPVEFRPPGL